MTLRGKYFLEKGIVNYILAVGKNRTSLTKISRRTKMTFSHVCNITDHLIYLGIIETNKEGRERKVKLTKKGHRIHDLLIQIREISGIKAKRRLF